jgi:hypothetical protein
VLAECRALDVPEDLREIEPLGQLPLPDQFFDIVISYSVFTHPLLKSTSTGCARSGGRAGPFVLTL